MKKLLVLTFAMLFLGVGIAAASDVTITGSYYMRGSHKDNMDGQGNAPAIKDYQEYDQELTFDVEFVASPVTKVFVRVEAVDNDMGRADDVRERSTAITQYDDNIVLEQVYGQHTFMSTKTTLRAGRMGANAWATAFGDEGGEANRIWLMQPSSVGTWFAVVEKLAATGDANETSETGTAALGDDQDKDGYILGLATKLGSVNLFPLVKYTKADSVDLDVFSLLLGAKGAVNNFGYEGELIYSLYDFGDQYLGGIMEDTYVFGAYGNVWGQFNALKVGGLIAYGSYDDNGGALGGGQGFEFGDDFTAGGALLLGDDIFFNGSNDSLNAVTLYALYASYAVSEKLTLGAYLGMVNSNVDKATSAWDGTDAWEFSVSGEYKITDNVTYSVAAGMAELEWGSLTVAGVTQQPDEAVEVFHKLAFSF